MEIRDFIITPILIVIVYVVAYIVRPGCTDTHTRKYFFLGLSAHILGALALGFVYQFYYGGGDTFNFHTHGSRHIWEAVWESPSAALEMFFSNGTQKGNFYKYSSQIFFFSDPSSYFVIRLAALLDIFTFSTYSATAVLFSVFSFTGMWMLFLTFYRKHPHLHGWFAAATLFIPSVFFWGSGLLKDTIVLGSLGIMTYELDRIFFQRKTSLLHILLLLLSLYFVFSLKKFVLQAYLPAAIVWIYMGNMQRLRSIALRITIFPFVVGFSILLAYYSIMKVGESDQRYAVDKLAETARITAMDIRYQTGREAGSGYSLGDLDGTFSGMVKLAPKAINVSLFRPYLWEVRNPLMLLSALESLFFLFMVLYILVKRKIFVLKAFSQPDVVFAIIFSLVFAFAVGVSTFNFGTLARYKIPLMPFFLIGLTLILHSNKDINSEALEETE